MRTISEAAKEYSRILQFQLAFLAGVKFAQQWIPVEEDLPEAIMKEKCLFYPKYVFVKINGYEYPNVAMYIKDNDKYFFKVMGLHLDTKLIITHWRPIELK